jgi:prepilin-type N-terminal cleavage/methylation domain-containing protein
MMPTKKNPHHEAGYTLIETMAAMVIMGVTFAYMMPIFLLSRVKIDASVRRSGAIIVAQRIVTDISSRKLSTLPVGGTPITITDPDTLTSAGKTYTASITYCPLPAIDKTLGNPACAGNRPEYREAEIKVAYKGSPVFGVQAAFADVR